MPRPPRCRRICDAPQVDTFCPQGHEEAAPILLTLDEYEVIRLVDLEQRTHQQCAAQMDISRSTVQEIYESARRKIAACLVYGRKLVITGNAVRRRLAAFINAVIQIMTQQCTLVIAAYGRNIRILCSVVCCIKGRKRSSGKTGLCGQ